MVDINIISFLTAWSAVFMRATLFLLRTISGTRCKKFCGAKRFNSYLPPRKVWKGHFKNHLTLPWNIPHNFLEITIFGQIDPLCDNRDVNKTDEKEAESSSSRQFVCSWPNCSKSYRTKSYLIEHRRIHTGDRPFTCSNCSRGFSRVTDVKKHQLLKVCHLNSK